MYLPDLFAGDALPEAELNSGNFDLMGWLGKHPAADIPGIVRPVLSALKAEGITKIAAVGYCYGGRPAFDLAIGDEVDVVAVSHPSLLKSPDDLEVCGTCMIPEQ